MKEQGLYYPDGTYSGRREVRRKLLAEELEGRSRRVSKKEATRRDFKKWTEIVTRQQDERKELLGIPEKVTVDIETSTPILVPLIGDVHAGGSDIDYKRFAKDVDLIKEARGYTIAVGDLTDSYFFMPGVGQQLVSGDEQTLYMQAALDELSEGDRLLCAWGGDHDMWPKDKSGAHTLYSKFKETYNADYLEGVSYLTINLNDGGNIVPYRMVGSHRHKGFSVYNDAHASLRQYRDEGVMSDLSFTAHNHVKAALRQTHKFHGGDEQAIWSVALGSYKRSDRYSRKMGWPRKDDASMGAFGLILYPTTKRLEVHWTLEDAVNRLKEVV